MPLSINVGLSRKASRDYQSTGFSINVTAELDQSLLTRPDELQAQIEDLYAQASTALDRQSGADNYRRRSSNGDVNRDITYGRSNGYSDQYGNGHKNGQSNGNGHRPSGGGMTGSQRRAIIAIARRINADPLYESQQIIGKEMDLLTIRDASQLIDHLKSLQPAGNGRNGSGR